MGNKEENKYKKILKTVIKILVSVGLIFYLLSRKVDKEELIENFKLLDWRYIPLVFSTIVIHYIISSFRWKSLLIHEKSDDVSRWYLFKLYFMGAFFNNFMPTSIGGDVFKMYKLGKKIKDPAVGFASVFTERFTGIVTLFLIGLLSMSRHLGWGIIIILMWFFVAMYIGMFILRVMSGKIKFFGDIYNSLMIYKNHLKILWFAMFTSFLIQLLSISTQYLLFVAVGIKMPIFYSLMAFPIITLVGFFVPSINGLGVQDTLYASMFSLVGVSPGTAISVSIMYHMIRMGVSLIGGVMYALDNDA